MTTTTYNKYFKRSSKRLRGKSTSKRPRDKSASLSTLNSAFWRNLQQNLDLKKVRFEDKYSREEWRYLQAARGDRAVDWEYDSYCMLEHWFNADYWVILDKKCRGASYKTFQGYPLWHLEICRHDGEPIRNWQIIQAIKNEVVGEAYEAVELYPAHSRLMDVCNKYHLWILAPMRDEEAPPHFELGSDEIGKVAPSFAIIFQEGIIQYYRTASKQERKQLRAKYKNVSMRIFPDNLRADLEKEFPGLEYTSAVTRYVIDHPELELQEFLFETYE
jgi:hypothetical protein